LTPFTGKIKFVLNGHDTAAQTKLYVVSGSEVPLRSMYNKWKSSVGGEETAEKETIGEENREEENAMKESAMDLKSDEENAGDKNVIEEVAMQESALEENAGDYEDEEYPDPPVRFVVDEEEYTGFLRSIDQSACTLYIYKIFNGPLQKYIYLKKPCRVFVPPGHRLTANSSLLTAAMNQQNICTYNLNFTLTPTHKMESKKDEIIGNIESPVTQKQVRSFMKLQSKKSANLHSMDTDDSASSQNNELGDPDNKVMGGEGNNEMDSEEKNEMGAEENNVPKQLQEEWKSAYKKTLDEIFQQCSTVDLVLQARSDILGLIIYWTTKHMFPETFAAKIRVNFPEELVTCFENAKKLFYDVFSQKNIGDMTERGRLQKYLHQACGKKMKDFPPEAMRKAHSGSKYTWNYYVTSLEDAGVGPDKFLQEAYLSKENCPIYKDENGITMYHMYPACGGDKGGTIMLMIYDAREHRLFRVGLGLAAFLDVLEQEKRILQSEIARNPNDIEENELRSIRMKEITQERRRVVDKVHLMIVKILTSTVKTDNGKKERRFRLIALPKMQVKGGFIQLALLSHTHTHTHTDRHTHTHTHTHTPRTHTQSLHIHAFIQQG
jgi:hypothetical protein